jgi:hypothetical protein
MKKLFAVLIFSTLLYGCTNNDKPNVSGIKINLTLERFERDFFAIDTNQLTVSIKQLQTKYPSFAKDFIQNILGLPPAPDDTAVQAAIKKFISDYRPVKDSVEKKFPQMKEIEEDVEEGLRYVKHYFPQYKMPEKLITFIGPMDAYFQASLGGYGDVLTTDALAVGLQMHLGRDFSLYKSEMGQALFPAYISRRFSPEYIPVNCIKNIIDDMFPDKSSGKALVEQMVEKGKRLYLLDKLMPDTHDTLKTGYTSKQLEGSYENEGLIWNFFLKNGLVYNNDPSIIKGYIGDAPNTPELGEGSPGYVGLFVGWQIVKKYMDSKKEVPLTTLMNTDPRKIFEDSKYRPR